jgi:hypothetical protein
MSRQEQQVEAEGIALQAGRDLVVRLGPTAQEFAQLMVELGKQLATFNAEGQAKVEQRLSEFRDEVLKEFANGTAAAPEALRDPDFQAVLADAQRNYVRNDDEEVAASLINLISERSQQTSRSRVSLSLNAAVEVMGALTGQDVATLTSLFHTRRAIVVTSRPEDVFAYLGRHVSIHVSQLPANSGSLDYLVTKGCITYNQFSSIAFPELVQRAYGCALADGFTLDELTQQVQGVGKERLLPLLSPVAGPQSPMFNFSLQASSQPELYRFNLQSVDKVKETALESGLGQPMADALHGFATSRQWSPDRVGEQMFKAQPALERFAELWTVSGMGSYSLTPLGIAIAHSNARRLFKEFRAPLSVWIF